MFHQMFCYLFFLCDHVSFTFTSGLTLTSFVLNLDKPFTHNCLWGEQCEIISLISSSFCIKRPIQTCLRVENPSSTSIIFLVFSYSFIIICNFSAVFICISIYACIYCMSFTNRILLCMWNLNKYGNAC